VWFDFFFTQPYHRFTIADRSDLETFVLLLLVGIAVTEVAGSAAEQSAERSAGAFVAGAPGRGGDAGQYLVHVLAAAAVGRFAAGLAGDPPAHSGSLRWFNS